MQRGDKRRVERQGHLLGPVEACGDNLDLPLIIRLDRIICIPFVAGYMALLPDALGN